MRGQHFVRADFFSFLADVQMDAVAKRAIRQLVQKGHPVAAAPAIMDSERFSGAEQRIRHRQHRRNPDPAANQQAVAGIHLKRKQIARRADRHRGADLEPMRRQRSSARCPILENAQAILLRMMRAAAQ